jgi:hypothetical protein
MKKMKQIFILVAFLTAAVHAREYPYNGLNNNMGNLFLLSNAKSRSILPENYTGEKGKGGMADPNVTEKYNIANAAHAACDPGTGLESAAAYFRMHYRRTNPNMTSDYTIVDNIRGKGHYVGPYPAVGVNNNGWWGEGEIKFFMDGDTNFPTICGTGTEDYFCGSSNFDVVGYQAFCTPYAGLYQVNSPRRNLP